MRNKKRFALQLMQWSLFAVVLFTFAAPQVLAYESPLKTLFGISDSAEINKSEKSEAEKNNQATDKQEKSPKPSFIGKPEKKRVPEVVSDSREIEKAAEFASNATGVRKEFILGMLVVESNLGRNPGECTYEEVAEGAKKSFEEGRLSGTAWQTFNARQEIIEDLADSLGYDSEKLKVSCNPGAAYAGTGGALGVPQFMPDTWLEYKDRIGAVVGKENPDPWDIEDGAVAMALKLSDVWGVTSHNTLAERNAAKIYLSGTTSSQYDWYATKILYWAKNYKELLG